MNGENEGRTARGYSAGEKLAERRPSLGPIATTPERRAEIRESSAAIRRHRRHTQAVLDALCGRHYSAGKKVAERKMVETRGDA